MMNERAMNDPGVKETADELVAEAPLADFGFVAHVALSNDVTANDVTANSAAPLVAGDAAAKNRSAEDPAAPAVRDPAANAPSAVPSVAVGGAVATSDARIPTDDVEAIHALSEAYSRLRAELGKVIIGQNQAIEQLAICLFARGHGLLMGVPGLAKTLLVSSLAQTLDLSFNRIQFTPDLMPSDITGTDIIQESGVNGRRQFEFMPGPVFANLVLADEINRAPAKTQSAMLEAMQEHKVTVLGRSYPLPLPFFVLATQNPIEQEGTYPLPEAQLDRFLFLIEMSYPSMADELRIARETTGMAKAPLQHIMSGALVLEYQQLVRRVPVPDHIYDLAVTLVRQTRPQEAESPAWLRELVSWGAGPRAVQALILGAKARAALLGSYLVRREDLEAVATAVLRHRVVTNFAAESQGLTAQVVVERLLTESRAAQA